MNSTPDQASLKMEARLIPIKSLLESLPNPFSNEHKEFSTTLISKSIEVLYCERRVDHHTANPTVHPPSIRFKFNLTCKAEYEENE